MAIKDEPAVLEIGEAEVVENFSGNNKRKVAFLGLGPMFTVAKEAASELAGDFDCALINPRFTKPIDKATTEYFAKTADIVVTLEDHVLSGGYGSIVADFLSEKEVHTPVIKVGWPDQFIEHASSVGELREKYGLTAKAVVEQVKTPPAKEAGDKASAVA